VVGQNGAISYGGGLYGGGRYGILFGPARNGQMALEGVGTSPNPFPASAGGGLGQGPSAAFRQATRECIGRLGLKNVLSYRPT
jgi:hypothetical protein